MRPYGVATFFTKADKLLLPRDDAEVLTLPDLLTARRHGRLPPTQHSELRYET